LWAEEVLLYPAFLGLNVCMRVAQQVANRKKEKELPGIEGMEPLIGKSFFVAQCTGRGQNVSDGQRQMSTFTGLRSSSVKQTFLWGISRASGDENSRHGVMVLRQRIGVLEIDGSFAELAPFHVRRFTRARNPI
jgi:hypothetical protein